MASGSLCCPNRFEKAKPPRGPSFPRSFFTPDPLLIGEAYSRLREVAATSLFRRATGVNMSMFARWFGRENRRSSKPGRLVRARLAVEGLEQREVPTVNFYGGNLLPHVEAQALYLGNEWSTVSANAAQTGTIDAYLKDLTGGAYMDALTAAGYNVGRGTASAGAVDSTALTPGSTITDASIQARLLADINSGLLQAPDANRLYIVYVEPNVAVNLGHGQGTTQQGILGYHGAFAGPNGSTIRYAVVPYPGGSAHNSSLGTTAIDQLTAVTSHELAEAVTDPDVNYGRLGWYDPRRGEIGDITENNPSALVRLDGYLVQEVANQNDQLLPVTGTSTTPTPPAPTPPTPTPPNNPTPPSTPTTTVATTTTLTASPVTHYSGFSFATLTVTVSPSSGTILPSGLVELIYQGRVLALARIHVVNGVATATFGVAFFGTGNFAFTTQYLGSSLFQGSTSAPVTVTV
jgi:hypothetical protein